MKLIIFFIFVGAGYAARLENTYLPPSTAKSAGGGPFLQSPIGGGYPAAGGSGRMYLPPDVKTYGPATPAVPILSYSDENKGDGNFKYSFETGDGTIQQAQGVLLDAGTDGERLSVQGSYSYTGPDGKVYSIRYTADEDGFHPEGDHLPTPPPIPEEILESLRKNAEEEARGGYSDEYTVPRTQLKIPDTRARITTVPQQAAQEYRYYTVREPIVAGQVNRGYTGFQPAKYEARTQDFSSRFVDDGSYRMDDTQQTGAIQYKGQRSMVEEFNRGNTQFNSQYKSGY